MRFTVTPTLNHAHEIAVGRQPLAAAINRYQPISDPTQPPSPETRDTCFFFISVNVAALQS